MTKLKSFISSLFILLGCGLIVVALVLLIGNIQTELKAKNYSENILTQITQDEDPDDITVSHTVLDGSQAYIDGELYLGVLTIPQIGIELPVQGDWSFEKMYNTPCVYSEDPFIIAAHNYTVHFGKLKNLKLGDQISFQDISGKTSYFELAKMEYIHETQIEKLYDEAQWDLTLYTCNENNNVERIVARFELLRSSS